MCRIAGIIDKNTNAEPLEEEVRSMCHVMKHGGPDDEGFYTDASKTVYFGHRRLALIDLTRGGHQPMIYNNGDLVITFNGEIYNYLDLKAELTALNFKFYSESDTEVILAAYQAWGKDGFDKLKGMFAFALHDKWNQTIYLVRDRTGIKPLYYSLQKEKLVFASEVKAFKATAYNYTENPDWRIFLLAFGHIPEPFTTLNEVKMLQKGHCLEYNLSANTQNVFSYTDTCITRYVTDSGEAKHLIKTAVNCAVKRHLVADETVGVFLSGGIDSSLLSLLAAKHQPDPIHTLSINFKDENFSEQKYQDIIHSKISGKHASYQIDEDIFNRHFPAALSAMDQPTADGINSWFISFYAKENGLKAVLSGIGADEYFGGYPSFKRMKWVNLLCYLPKFIRCSGRYFNVVALRRSYYLSYKNTVGKYLFLRGICTPEEISGILNCSLKQVDETLNKLSVKLPDHLENEEQAAWLETNMYLQNQLLKDTDFMSMQHGVEVRVPFLDQEIVNALQSVSTKIKYGQARPKSLLINAFINLLPEKIWKRKKMGFTFPFQHWLAKNDFFLNRLALSSNPYVNATTHAFTAGEVHWSKMMAIYLVLHS